MSVRALQHHHGVTQVGAGQARHLPHVGLDHVEGRGGACLGAVVPSGALEVELDAGHSRAARGLTVPGDPKHTTGVK